MKLDRELQRIQHQPPFLAFGEGIGESHERGGFLLRRRRPLIGNIRGRACPLAPRRAVIFVGRGNEQPDIGQPAPSLGIVGRDRHDLHIKVGGAFEVLALEQRLGLLLQLDDRLGDGPRFVLEVGLERDYGVVESVVVKGLGGGVGRGGGENKQRGEQAGAKPCGHGHPPGTRTRQTGARPHGSRGL